MKGRYRNVASRAARPPATSGRRSWPFRPRRWRSSWPPKPLADYRLLLERLLRYKPHTLGKSEEKLLAMQTEMAEAAEPDLSPAERRRPEVRHGQEREGRAGRAEQRHVSARSCTRPSASVRKKAFHQYYAQFAAHENTLAATLGGLGPARRLLRPGAELPQRARGRRCFPTRCRLGRVRQPDRLGPSRTCRRCIATTTCGGGR